MDSTSKPNRSCDRRISGAAAQAREEYFRVCGVDVALDVVVNLHITHLAAAVSRLLLLLRRAAQVLGKRRQNFLHLQARVDSPIKTSDVGLS